MSEHTPRYILGSSAIQAALVNDVLCVQLSGNFTPQRLQASLRMLRRSAEWHAFGALVLNIQGARLKLTVQELAQLWSDEGCPLASRPCAVVYDSRQRGAAAFYEALGMRLADGQPARLMGAFAGRFLPEVMDWAAQRALGYRLELDRQRS